MKNSRSCSIKLLILPLALVLLPSCSDSRASIREAAPQSAAAPTAENCAPPPDFELEAAEASPSPRAAKDVTIGTYTTDYGTKTNGRTHNIALGAQKLTGTVVMPNEIFSFNGSVGKVNRAAGFKTAKIFVLGREENGVGGGICQISSTLYNAALSAGMEIKERHPHSKKVSYVPDGLDAAVSAGGADLKFVNTRANPITIRVSAADGKITAEIIEAVPG